MVNKLSQMSSWRPESTAKSEYPFFGTRSACEKALTALGGIPAPGVTGKLDFLVVGSGCNEQWANTTYGRKIEAALERKPRYGKPAIISEKVWVEAMKHRAPC